MLIQLKGIEFSEASTTFVVPFVHQVFRYLLSDC